MLLFVLVINQFCLVPIILMILRGILAHTLILTSLNETDFYIWMLLEGNPTKVVSYFLGKGQQRQMKVSQFVISNC